MAKEGEGSILLKCPHCESSNVEYFNYEWFCMDCDEQWNATGEDTK